MQKLKWNLRAERELWASICSPNGLKHTNGKRYTHPDSLYWFDAIAWGIEWYIREGNEIRWFQERVHKPYLNWYQKRILDWKESRKQGKVVRWRVCTIIPRGFGKTVTTTKGASLWAHLDEPNMTTVIGSEIHTKAQEFLGPIKEIIQGRNPTSWFTWLYGAWYDPDREWTKVQVVHGYRRSTALTEPSFGTFGVDTGITGYHPLMVMWDDPISQNKLSDVWLRSVSKAFHATFPAARTDGFIGLVMTRYSDADPAGEAFEEGVIEWAGMPPIDGRIKINPKGNWYVYFLQGRDTRDTKEYPRGRPILPEVWPDGELIHYEDTKPFEYAAQIQNDPSTGEHMPLTKDQVEQLYFDRKHLFDPDTGRLNGQIPIKYATIHLDTAFSEDRVAQGDNSVIAVCLHDLRDNGIVYLDNVIASPALRVDQFNNALVNEVIRLKRLGIRVRAITDEKEPGGKVGSWRMLMEQALAGAGVRGVEIIQKTRQGTKKLQRIKTSAGYWAEGFIKLVVEYVDGEPKRDTPGILETVYEMLNIGTASFDDRADALADLWDEEIWTRPTTVPQGMEGAIIIQPGDEGLKAFARPVSIEELRDLYDQQHYPVGEYDEPWLPYRE
jgi:hypothetical protein